MNVSLQPDYGQKPSPLKKNVVCGIFCQGVSILIITILAIKSQLKAKEGVENLEIINTNENKEAH